MTTAVVGDIIPSDKPGQTAIALRQPVGVVLGLAPWNAPVILGRAGARRCRSPAAIRSVLKGSEVCPRTHRLIGEAFHAAGCGEGVVNVVSNAPADASRDRRGADRPSGGAAGQFHRLDARRTPRC